MAKKAKENKSLPIFILNGPNLNLLGEREPEIYGRTTLAQIGQMAAAQAKGHGLALAFRQSNHEGELVDWIQEARTHASAIVINPGAYSHTSVALLDALSACTCPIIEVHLSNLARRERFRHHSWVSKAATGVIMGLGAQGYLRAIDAIADILKAKKK